MNHIRLKTTDRAMIEKIAREAMSKIDNLDKETVI
jgi:hypothetical protein